jgi:hypothetical protein
MPRVNPSGDLFRGALLAGALLRRRPLGGLLARRTGLELLQVPGVAGLEALGLVERGLEGGDQVDDLALVVLGFLGYDDLPVLLGVDELLDPLGET